MTVICQWASKSSNSSSARGKTSKPMAEPEEDIDSNGGARGRHRQQWRSQRKTSTAMAEPEEDIDSNGLGRGRRRQQWRRQRQTEAEDDVYLEPWQVGRCRPVLIVSDSGDSRESDRDTIGRVDVRLRELSASYLPHLRVLRSKRKQLSTKTLKHTRVENCKITYGNGESYLLASNKQKITRFMTGPIW